jgi:hypothetical protein
MQYKERLRTADGTWAPPKEATNHAVTHQKGGVLQLFGIDYRAAVLAISVDIMAQAATTASVGLLYPVELCAAPVLGFITYKIQRSWYGDDHDSALIKALIIALVTAIPVPVTPLLAGPSGFLGLLRAMTRKS